MSIRTTFIAGSPGETDAEHAELVQFVKDFGFDMMGVFPYSPEPGTPMGRMTDQIARRREAGPRGRVDAGAAGDRVRQAPPPRWARTIQVMIDRPAGRDAADGFVARHAGQAPDIDSVVHVDGNGVELHPGQFVDVKVTDYQAYDLVAKVPRKKGRALKVVTA